MTVRCLHFIETLFISKAAFNSLKRFRRKAEIRNLVHSLKFQPFTI